MGQFPWAQRFLTFSLIAGCLMNVGFYCAQNHQPKVVHHILMAAFGPFLDSSSEAQNPSVKTTTPATNYFMVPLKKDNRALMLDATLDDQENATLILDTGATYTAISQSLANRLGYDLTTADRVNITTANGQVSLPKVVLKSLTLNGYTAHNVEATVMPLPNNVPFSGLLGLNFIRQHRITIDAKDQDLVIEAKGA